MKGDEKYMKRKNINRIIFGLIAVLLTGNKVYASEINENHKGTIIIECKNSAQEIKSKFLCDKIADLENGTYIMRPGYVDKNLDINGIHTADELKKLVESIDQCENEKTLIQYADREGKVRFEHLEAGIYFVRNENTKEKQMVPILVSVPMWDEAKQIMSQEVTVIPKYTKRFSNHTKQPVKTGDDKKSLIKVMLLCLISFGAIQSTRTYFKILQKY